MFDVKFILDGEREAFRGCGALPRTGDVVEIDGARYSVDGRVHWGGDFGDLHPTVWLSRVAEPAAEESSR